MSTTYVVISPKITVLRSTEAVKQEQELWDRTPDAWKQGKWTNVVVSENNELSTDEYEPRRLYQLFTNGYLKLARGESQPQKPSATEEGAKREPTETDKFVEAEVEKEVKKKAKKGRDKKEE